MNWIIKVLIGLTIGWIIGSAFLNAVYKYFPIMESYPEIILLFFVAMLFLFGKKIKRFLV